MKTMRSLDEFQRLSQLMDRQDRLDAKLAMHERQEQLTEVLTLEEFCAGLPDFPEIVDFARQKKATLRKRHFGDKFQGEFWFTGTRPARPDEAERIDEETVAYLTKRLNLALKPLNLTVVRLSHELAGWSQVNNIHFQHWDVTAHLR